MANWWRRTDLNRGHCGYEPHALANWATPPFGADDQDWTGDLILTKDTLCRLSYISIYMKKIINMVAGAGLEPATFGLWARRATNCSTPRYLVGGIGFEPMKAKPADLQSAPFNHSGISPCVEKKLELAKGIEPSTYWLQISCSTDWAMPAN